MRYFILSFLCIISGNYFAQLAKTFSINFESNAYQLTSYHKKQIDSVFNFLATIPEAYSVEVKGHTDNHGSLQLNTVLSKNRANAVLTYLKSKNCKTTDSSMHFYAYNKPFAENTEENLWKNRRVEINLYVRKLDMVKILGIKDFGPKNYKLIEDEGGTIQHDSTKIVIAPNSFTHQNGTEVTGEIEVSYMEYRNPSDFLLSGIPMSIKTGNDLAHFNSGGMFQIKVYQNGEELQLKNSSDKKIALDFPLNNFTDQRFFQFDTTANQWNNNAVSITDPHGNMLAPFNALQGGGIPNATNNDLRDFLSCVANEDTCKKVSYIIDKINYFLAHDEPVKSNQPYKFIKNHLVDFKTPLYQVKASPGSSTFEIIPKNSHNRLGKFTNYVWEFNKRDYEKVLVNYQNTGVTNIKIEHRASNKFIVTINGETLRVNGKPKNYDESLLKKSSYSFGSKKQMRKAEKKMKRLNKTNYKEYSELAKKFNEQDLLASKRLKEIADIPQDKDILNDAWSDSLRCINYFYKAFLQTVNDKNQFSSIQDYNLLKDSLRTKMKDFKSPYKCKGLKVFANKRDSINRIFIAKMDSASGVRLNTFAKFGINQTGIFNADQVKSIENPLVIYADYKNENQQDLDILSIYVSIDKINGIINYNGYMDYGPKKFVYGSKDRTMLIAVDKNEKSYYCTPEEFQQFVTQQKDGKTHFVLRPLQNLESKENLQKIVSK